MKNLNIIFLLLVSNLVIAMEAERKSLASFFDVDTFTQHEDITKNLAQQYLHDKQWWYVDKEVQFYGVYCNSTHPLLSKYPNYLKCVCFDSSDTKIIAFPSQDGGAHIWDRDGKKLERLDNCDLDKFYEDRREWVDKLYNSGNSPWTHNYEDDIRELLKKRFGVFTMLCVYEGQGFVIPQFRLPDREICDSCTAYAWNHAEDKVLFSLLHNNIINSVDFNPQGIEIITASADGTMRLWHKKTGKELLCFKYDKRVTSASFNGAGTEIVLATDDGNIQILAQYHTDNVQQILLKKLLHLWLQLKSPSKVIDSPEELLKCVAQLLLCDEDEIKNTWTLFPEHMQKAIWSAMYKKIQRYGK